MPEDLRNTGASYRITVGIISGILLATVFGLIAAVSGGRGDGADTLRALDLSLWRLMAIYIVMGIVGGGTFGALLPLGRSRWGACVLGVLVATLAYTLMVLSLFPGLAFEADRLALALLLLGIGVLTGVPSGLFFWQPVSTPRSPTS